MKFHLLLILLCVHFSLFAQTSSESEQDFNLTNFNQEKIQSIELLKTNLIQTKQNLIAKEYELNSEKDPRKKLQLESELKNVSKRYDKLKLNLISAITNIKMEEVQAPTSMKRDYLQEIQDLLGPAFDTVQRISEKPRKIEALRKELQIYNQRLALTKSALKSIEIVEGSKDFQALLPDIKDFLDDASYNVQDLNQELKLKIERLNRELSELTKDDKSLIQAFTDLFKQFLSERGKHLAISGLIFIAIVWLMSSLKNRVVLKLAQKGTVEWFYKPFSALYGFFTFLIALTVSILSLYLMGDWVLFTLIILFISAVLWGSKSYLHKYLAQGRLILNLGTIKEGELVIFRDIPWKVKNINFVTIFENEYLDSSNVRVEISQIFHMHSRKILSNEQWFPTKTNDWVLLSDGTYGQIKMQTIEQIIVEIKGHERKYLTTSDYLSLRPVNLSHGFTLDVTWNLDYQDMDVLLADILPRFRLMLSQKLTEHGLNPKKHSLVFHSAGSHSLNLLLEASFSGDHAGRRIEIQCGLNQIMLEISIEMKLSIPFNQIVVHQASAGRSPVL